MSIILNVKFKVIDFKRLLQFISSYILSTYYIYIYIYTRFPFYGNLTSSSTESDSTAPLGPVAQLRKPATEFDDAICDRQ
jgi:hypothetical protein